LVKEKWEEKVAGKEVGSDSFLWPTKWERKALVGRVLKLKDFFALHFQVAE
jgi:hypothetical protein